MEQCNECGGYNAIGTCFCEYDLILGDPLESFEPPVDTKQICHFCGVDLFLPQKDFNVRMCVPCGLTLDHEDCCVCVVCNNMVLAEGNCSVCESCRSL